MILTEILCFNLHAQAPNYCPARWSVCVCISCCACVCVCKQWCTVFHSWINPGQCLRGLQVNVAYFKRLFLHGHSVSEAHLHTNAFWDKDKSQQGKKPPDVVYAFVCLFFVFFFILFNQQMCRLSAHFFLLHVSFHFLWRLSLLPFA